MQQRKLWLSKPPWMSNNLKLSLLRMAFGISPLFAYDGHVRGAYRILVNPTSGGSQPLGGTPTNLYQGC